MEQAGQLRDLLIDKTGTLTRGEPAVIEAVSADGIEETELRALAAQAEAGIDHPVARALQDPAQVPDRGIHRRREGRGVIMTGPDGSEVRVGSRRWLHEAGVEVPVLATPSSHAASRATQIHVTRMATGWAALHWAIRCALRRLPPSSRCWPGASGYRW